MRFKVPVMGNVSEMRTIVAATNNAEQILIYT
jgi:hypothetical protein